MNWSDVNFELRTVRVTAKPNLGFSPSGGKIVSSSPSGTPRRTSEA